MGRLLLRISDRDVNPLAFDLSSWNSIYQHLCYVSNQLYKLLVHEDSFRSGELPCYNLRNATKGETFLLLDLDGVDDDCSVSLQTSDHGAENCARHILAKSRAPPSGVVVVSNGDDRLALLG
jgi:hypothetical protein